MHIGQGEFGEVYRGTWKGRDVAIKLLKRQASDDARRDFFKEGNILKCVHAMWRMWLCDHQACFGPTDGLLMHAWFDKTLTQIISCRLAGTSTTPLC